MDDLTNVLKGEITLYSMLLPVVEEKTVVIVKNDLARLQEITAKEQEILDKVVILEQRRLQVLEQMGVVLNRKNEQLKLQDIVSFLGNQPKEQKELSLLHDELKRLIGNLMNTNERNKKLIEQSLEMIEFNMNVLHSARMAPGNNYNNVAKDATVPASQLSMFDTKR